MAFPEKITNREYKIAGAFIFVLGGFLLAGSVGLLTDQDPEPVALIVLSGVIFLSGLISLLTKPIRLVLFLGPLSAVAYLITAAYFDGELLRKWGLELILIVTAIGSLCVGGKRRKQLVATNESKPASSESAENVQAPTQQAHRTHFPDFLIMVVVSYGFGWFVDYLISSFDVAEDSAWRMFEHKFFCWFMITMALVINLRKPPAESSPDAAAETTADPEATDSTSTPSSPPENPQ